MRSPDPTRRRTLVGPPEQVRRAQAEAAAAERAVAAASAQRLEYCLRLPPPEQIRHLDHPDLVPADRIALRRSLEASLVPGRRRLPRLGPRGQWSRRTRSILIRVSLSPLMIGLVVVGGPWLYVSWKNTRPMATLVQKGLVAFTCPGGREEYLVLAKGTTVTVFDRSAADPVIGLWCPRLDYALATVPRPSLKMWR